MWRVITTSVNELEAQLNALESEEFDIFSITPVGAPEIESRVPREHKSLEQRTTFAVVAHRAARSPERPRDDDRATV